MSALLQPEDRVLSTLNADGSRRWLDPKPVKGKLRSRRLLVAWILIAIFNVLPHLHLNGRQLFFVNIAGGEFTAFGVTYLRTDTLLLALTAIAIAVSVFLVTALFGRVWCGWACPQTVYLEFLYRPIASLFDGKGKKGIRGAFSKLPKKLRVTLRWSLVVLVSFHLANTFLAYFVGSTTVREWSMQSPLEHPAGFAFVLFVTAAMVWNFGFFREQLCFIACPYGRFQSVLLDAQSLIVGYDKRRGEPRGFPRKRKKAAATTDISLKVITDTSTSNAATTNDPAPLGDCVDCTRCVQVCPTGIDIRDGLQMECIHCARCIDACDEVMTKLGRDTGLIRYSSQNILEGKAQRFLRPRVVIYPAIFMVVFSALLVLSATHAAADVRLIREKGQPFYALPEGEISNQIRLRLTNRTSEPATYTVAPAAEHYRIEIEGDPAEIAPRETRSIRMLLIASPDAPIGNFGVTVVPLRVTDGADFEEIHEIKFIGPMNRNTTPDTAPTTTQQDATP